MFVSESDLMFTHLNLFSIAFDTVMSFQKTKERLEQIFHDHDFASAVRANNRHCYSVVLEHCESGAIISVSFPGYKARIIDNGKVIFDYRIDIVRRGVSTALSHANIIVDIFSKIVSGGIDGAALSKELAVFACSGAFGLDLLTQTLAYTPVAPSAELKTAVNTKHIILNKRYNADGNSSDLTLGELFTSIKWIVAQEDYNYPIKDGYEGRRMCFARYIEAIDAATSNNLEQLLHVVERALSHGRPPKLHSIDYSFLSRIVD